MANEAHREGQWGRGPGPITPDGSAVELYLKWGPDGEPAIIGGALLSPSEILEMGCGTGRLTRPLRELGHSVTAVDESAEMLRHVAPPTVRARIEELDLPDKFDAVLLASRLLNLVPAAIRRRYLRACRRHLRDDGILIAQLHDPALFDAAPFERRSGDRVFAVHDVRIFDDGRVSSTLITRIGEQQWLQGITVWRFDEAELDGMLAAEGLRRMRYLDEAGSWFAAAAV